MQWMHERRECAETASELPTIAGAVECVREIDQRVAPVLVYITVRPDSLAQVTARWLEQKGFAKASLICRPAHIPFEEGNRWKAALLKRMYLFVFGIVDDDPSVLMGFFPSPGAESKVAISSLPHGYKGTLFFFGHDEDEAAAILRRVEENIDACRLRGVCFDRPSVVVCPDWNEVLSKAAVSMSSD